MSLKLLLIGLAVLNAVTGQENIPTCIQACLNQVGTTLCADHALHDLTPCLSTTCSNPPATQNLIASLDVAFSPKAEYSCQQAYGPADSDKESSSVTLPLNGSCATSPYEFKSFLPQGVNRIQASNGCRVMTFTQEDCLGETASSDIGTLSNGRCVFRGGRSARLACRNELDAARAYIQTSCGKDDEDEEEPDNESSSASSSSTVYPSSAPYHGPGPTSFGAIPSSSIPFHWPFSSSRVSSMATVSSLLVNATESTPTVTTIDTPTLPPASVTTFSNGSSPSNSMASPQNGTRTSIVSPDSPQNTTRSLTLTLTGTPTVSATLLPTYTGLAARLGGGVSMGVALGVVGAGFVAFL